jgi:hypothetical protein
LFLFETIFAFAPQCGTRHCVASVALQGPQFTRIVQAAEVAGIVIHPAMVFTPRDAVERDAIRVVGDERVRWPLVHDEYLAELYVLAPERAPAGSSYLGAAIEGLAVGRIARAFASRFGTRHPEPEIVATDAIARERAANGRGLCARPAIERREGEGRSRLEPKASGSGKRNRAAFVSAAGKNEKARWSAGLCRTANLQKSGAGEGIRTLDPDLGKVVLYH